MTRVGLIARMDKSGLGQGQTLRIAKLLKPDHIMLIDSTSFNRSEQHPEWYRDYSCTTIDGFPHKPQVDAFLDRVDVVISCELFYDNFFTDRAREKGVKTILIANWEFFDWHSMMYADTWSLPDKIVLPSTWHLEEMEEEYNAVYLPTPIFKNEFSKARKTNMERSGAKKYLFINGKTAHMDRNGLKTLYAALEKSTGDYTVTVKYQGDIVKHPDPRLIYDDSNPDDQSKLYTGYDALILPRRYAGQSLPMCEALQSALPVFMTDISPNDDVLPSEWLISSQKIDSFMARTMIDVYEGDAKELAHLLDTFDATFESKQIAYAIGMQYDAEFLSDEYQQLIDEVMA